MLPVGNSILQTHTEMSDSLLLAVDELPAETRSLVCELS